MVCSRTGSKADCLVVSCVLLLAIFEDGSNIGFLNSWNTSPILSDFSKMMESSGATISASSIGTHRCIPAGLVDLSVLSLFSCL